MLSFDEFEPHLSFTSDTTYLINFWATWCTPCVEELPHIKRVAEEHSTDRFRVILVSLDFPRLIESRLIPFVRKHGLGPDIIVLHEPDANEWIPRVHRNWSGAIPATLIYNRKQRLFFEKTFEYRELKSIVEQIL